MTTSPRAGLALLTLLALATAAGAAGATGDRPTVAIRVECNDGLPSPLCDAVLTAATTAAARVYQVINPNRLETVLAKEPALRDCHRGDCRVAISEQLGTARLIDVTIHQKGHGSIAGNVSIYDSVAKDISGDTDIPPTRRDEGHVRRAIADAVEYVIGAQRLTATLHLDVKPEGARISVDGNDRGTARELQLFLGPHTIRAEKVGYIAGQQTVNVSPAGAGLAMKLLPQPIPVKLEWSPPDTRVLVDGDPVDARNAVVELVEGRHRVQALAQPGSGYDSRELDIDVHPGMDPVRIQLQRLAELRILAPAGYSLRVDQQIINPDGAGAHLQKIDGTTMEVVTSTSPGPHTVTASSWRGRQRSVGTLAVPGSRTEIVIRAPSLAPGLVLMGLGLLAIAGGAAMVALDGQPNCDQAPTCPTVLNLLPQGVTALAAGGAALIAGTIWFGYNAADHPLFRSRRHGAGTPASLSLRSSFIGTGAAPGGALIAEGRF